MVAKHGQESKKKLVRSKCGNEHYEKLEPTVRRNVLERRNEIQHELCCPDNGISLLSSERLDQWRNDVANGLVRLILVKESLLASISTYFVNNVRRILILLSKNVLAHESEDGHHRM